MFEWDATLGVAVGKLAIENPLRHSIYISGIRFEEAARQDIVVKMSGNGLYDVISDAYEEAASPNNRVAVVNARIPPRDNLEFELKFKNHGTGLRVTFEWSTAMPWTVKCLIPRRLKYSATDIDAMKRAAKRGEPKEEK
ncbi:MAG: hypothetical protein ACREJ5_19610 [Geminicoccaceae bacterium]